MHSLDFFHFCIQKNSQNNDIVMLLSCNFNREISCLMLFLHFNVFRRYPLSDIIMGFCLWGNHAFRELLFCQISQNSNEKCLSKQFISTKTTSHIFLPNAHAWLSSDFSQRRLRSCKLTSFAP